MLALTFRRRYSPVPYTIARSNMARTVRQNLGLEFVGLLACFNRQNDRRVSEYGEVFRTGSDFDSKQFS
jgi:hypothetical protein